MHATVAGVITVEQTVECGCEDKKCHREDYYESYWEVVEGIDRNGTVVKEKVTLIVFRHPFINSLIHCIQCIISLRLDTT